jgi:GTP cyclohydrolase I
MPAPNRQASTRRATGCSRVARSALHSAPSSDGPAKTRIANTINVLEPQGVGVIIKASHHCMTTRGVRKPDTDLVISRMLGCFRDNALTRQEFLGMAT